MPKFKVTGKAEETRSGFEAYDGPELSKPGMYRSVLKKLLVRQYNSGAVALRGLFELEAQKGDPKKHKQFDGAPFWGNVFFVTQTMPLKDGTQRALNNFLAGLGVTKEDPDIVTEAEGDITKGIQVKSIGGKAVSAFEGKKAFSLDLRTDGDYGLQINNIYPAKDVTFEAAEDEDEPEVEAEDEDAEEEAEEEQSAEEREEELSALTLAALRKLAKELEIETTGLKKDALIEGILDVEFGEAEEAEPDEDEPEDEDEAEDEAEDEPEDDEEEEEEAEDDGRDERRAELAELKRPALLKIVKEVATDFRPLKRHSDEELIEAIITAEFGSETPF